MSAANALSTKPSPARIKILSARANAIADLLASDRDGFWHYQARPLVAALIVREVIERHLKADLGNVPRLLSSPFVVNDENPDGLWNALREICAHADDFLAPPMEQHLIDSRLTDSIICTAIGESQLLRDPAVAAALLKSLLHLI